MKKFYINSVKVGYYEGVDPAVSFALQSWLTEKPMSFEELYNKYKNKVRSEVIAEVLVRLIELDVVKVVGK